MFRLNDKSKSAILRSVGLSVEDISRMSWDKIDSFIEKKIGKKLRFGMY